MRITLDISMYPLQATYKPAILHFISHLEGNPKFTLRVNALSTQVQGEMSEVFAAVQAGIAEFFDANGRASFVLKVLPGDIVLDYGHPSA